jgi:hypothetical protein
MNKLDREEQAKNQEIFHVQDKSQR